jgi:hypothetical protein
MSKINAFSRVLNRKGKTRFFYGFSFVDCLNPLDAKPFSLISAKGFLVKFVYREVMTY